VFDRYGERNNRNKARMKFLIQKIGLEEVLHLTQEERIANKVKTFVVNRDAVQQPAPPAEIAIPEVTINNPLRYEQWLITNVFEQKQTGFYGVYVKVPVGDIPTDIVKKVLLDDALRQKLFAERDVEKQVGLVREALQIQGMVSAEKLKAAEAHAEMLCSVGLLSAEDLAGWRATYEPPLVE